MKKKKLDIRKLLQGTKFEDKADIMAKRIEARGWDNDHDIWSIPEGGSKFFGESAPAVVQVIVAQSQKPEAPEPQEPDVPEPQKPEPIEEKIPEVSAPASALAKEHGIDLSAVQGTGRKGTIIKADVEKLIA
jgi:pyruvate/2-oxoglutarate dehydrogenase complex dihydrolipoamide acyltransferase (E2) component